MCRVLVVPRALYNALSADFPLSTAAIMDNLVARAEEVRCTVWFVVRAVEDLAAMHIGAKNGFAAILPCNITLQCPTQTKTCKTHVLCIVACIVLQMLQHNSPRWELSTEPSSSMGVVELQFATQEVLPRNDPLHQLQQESNHGYPALQQLPITQKQTLANLLRVRALVSATRARLEQQRTHEFLHACSSGNLERIRVVRRWQQHCYM
jgi:hypothetical protein